MAYARIQGANSDPGSGGPFTCVFTNPVTANNAVLVYILIEAPITDAVGITDDKGNPYTKAGTAVTDGTDTVFLFFSTGITNGPKTITVADSTTPGSSVDMFIIEEFSGVALSSAFDGYNAQQGNFSAGTNTIVTPNFTTTVNGDLIWGVAFSGNGHSVTAGTGFTAGSANNLLSAFTSEWQTQATASSTTKAQWSLGTADGCLAAALALKPAAAAPGVVPGYGMLSLGVGS